jgi:outer membrane scaffolding protein for murein synthesis (MipA/OmpV family)
MESYFGIMSAQSVRSGLPQYSPVVKDNVRPFAVFGVGYKV